uniref:ENT domain-containing protein n=1 Tax=Caenorhabditis tropicalis TaxID=1561998 RepID=A0A1I7TCU3_9PELO
MTVKISMEVPPEMIKRMETLDDASLAALCDAEVAKRIYYLETVLQGWKTYKKVKEEHRRLLFLMLKAENKNPLHDYERLVLYPKVVDKKNDELPKKVDSETKSIDGSSTTSTARLGADSSDSSNEESGTQSPVSELQSPSPRDIVKSGVAVILVQKDAASLFKKPSLQDRKPNEPTKRTHKQSSTPSVVPPKNRNPVAVLLDSAEDQSVVGVSENLLLSENIVLAAQKVRMALDNVEFLQSASFNNSGNSLTKLNLLKLESKLMQSVSEVSKVEARNTLNLSKGTLKRQKKAAKKAADAAMTERKNLEKRLEAERQSRLAAEALIALSAKSSKLTETIVTSSSKLPIMSTLPLDSEEEETLPLTKEELNLFSDILKSGKTEFEAGSKEYLLMKKYEANRVQLEAFLRKNCDIEAKYNSEMLKQIRQLTDEIQGISSPQQLTKEEEMKKAMDYIKSKMELWKNSSAPQAPHFVEMYQYFSRNINSGIANVICGYLPYEYLPNAEFEQTMLMQYQSGRMFEKIVDKSEEENPVC